MWGHNLSWFLPSSAIGYSTPFRLFYNRIRMSLPFVLLPASRTCTHRRTSGRPSHPTPLSVSSLATLVITRVGHSGILLHGESSSLTARFFVHLPSLTVNLVHPVRIRLKIHPILPEGDKQARREGNIRIDRAHSPEGLWEAMESDEEERAEDFIANVRGA